MSNAVFELNLAGLNELMKSAEMQAILKTAGEQVANTAEGMASDKEARYNADVVTLTHASIGRVHATNGAAMREDYANNTLEKALRSISI